MILDDSQDKSRSVRVLYIDSAGPFGGAGRSLFESVSELVSKHAVQAFFIATAGTIVPYYRKVATDILTVGGIPKFDNTRLGRYRGVRWLILLRELAYVPVFAIGLARARARFGAVDIVHANEILELFPLLMAKLVFRAQAVLHVRSPQSQAHSSFRNRFIYFLINRYIDSIIAIDAGVARTLPDNLKCHVVNNAFAHAQYSHCTDNALQDKLRAAPLAAIRVGFVGNLYRSKGIVETVKAFDLLRSRGVDAVLLVLGGATRKTDSLFSRILKQLGFEDNVDNLVMSMIRDLHLESRVVMLGPSDDIGEFYRSIDLLCFATWLDGPGRPVFEAAFFGRPSLVAVRSPTPDTLIHRVTGIAIDTPDPTSICKAIEELVSDREGLIKMGVSAQGLAVKNNSPSVNASRIISIYRDLFVNTNRRDL
jgi:glycosyltransferase involved in cell wall biosynthesis